MILPQKLCHLKNNGKKSWKFMFVFKLCSKNPHSIWRVFWQKKSSKIGNHKRWNIHESLFPLWKCSNIYKKSRKIRKICQNLFNIQFDDFLTKNKRFKKLITFVRYACSSIFHRILHPDSGFLQDPINQCAQLDQDGKPSPRKIWITKRECIKFESTWLTS